MGLTADITADIQDAFDGELADAVKVSNLIYYSTVYDTSTGVVTNTETPEATRGVIDYVNESMIDDEVIQRGDVSILILQGELAVTPQIDDFIQEGTTRYRLYNISSDPADVQWTLLARAA